MYRYPKLEVMKSYAGYPVTRLPGYPVTQIFMHSPRGNLMIIYGSASKPGVQLERKKGHQIQIFNAVGLAW